VKPYYDHAGITIYHGDCREILPSLGLRADAAIADPPYGDTALDWDVALTDWLPVLSDCLKSTGSLWCFGSLRMFMAQGPSFFDSGWRMAQDLVWEKHNGSGFAADRFKRVHEHVAQFYRKAARWADIYKAPVKVSDPRLPRKVSTRIAQPTHTGKIGGGHRYVSDPAGVRFERSVLRVRSCNGHAEHPTQKPIGILNPLITYSTPPGGLLVIPFMGAGSDCVAAKSLGRRAVACEIKEEYCEIAARRLSQEVLPLDLSSDRDLP
jgi:site-specific DNA-methyltransferase (adenine-specific)